MAQAEPLAVQVAREWWPFAVPVSQLPDPTPAEGPDPYGNPDPDWLRIDWREHRRWVELETPPEAELLEGSSGPTTVNYVEMGSGVFTILFVHGLSGCWQNWLENIPHFARDHRVIAVDLPGFGASPMPPWQITIPAYGRFLRDFCERVGFDRCSLIGNSMGGFIGT